MRSTQYLSAVLVALSLLEGVVAQQRGRKGGAGSISSDAQSATASTSTGSTQAATTSADAAGATGATGGNQATTLKSDVIAKGSQSNGNPSDGQAPSLTDNANFINFCAGKTITNGEQNLAGSCNPIPMGEIPAKANMISTILTNPKNGDNLPADQPFNIELQTTNLQAGSFTNPNVTYYAAPQHLKDGKIIGHVHVAVQDMGDNTTPPDPSVFAFFKGINDAGDGKGKLSTPVTKGVPAGNYRICTMVAAANHQAVLMPVAQRGAQDDCIRITVGNPGAAGSNSSSAAAASATPGTQKRRIGARDRAGSRFVEREFIV